MFALAWDVDELTQLGEKGRTLHAEILAAQDIASKPDVEHHLHNLPRRLSSIREKRLELIRNIMRFRRKPATHVFVFMISSELRDKKPYALPVQCIPYAGLTENDLRRLVNKLVNTMVTHGLPSNVAGIYLFSSMKNIYMNLFIELGFVSNGEFNFLRTKGYTRPLSVLQIRSNVRKKYSQIGFRALLSMLTPKCKMILCFSINYNDANIHVFLQ